VAGPLHPITDGLLQLIKQIADMVQEIEVQNNAGVQRLKDLFMPVLQDNFGNVDQEELEVIATTVLLGPKMAGEPPLDFLKELLDMKKKYAKTDFVHIAIKYGVFPQQRKWNDQGNPDSNYDQKWYGVWPGAKEELSKLIYYAVTNAYRQLKRIVVGLLARDRSDFESDAEIITERFLEPLSPEITTDAIAIRCLPDQTEVKANWWKSPVPLGGRCVMKLYGKHGSNINIFWPDGTKTVHPNGTKVVVKAAEAFTTIRIEPEPKGRIPKIWEWNEVHIKNVNYIQVWECTCGRDYCEKKHRLEAWDPGVVYNLRSFIDSAMWGPLPITTGGLAGGMYFAFLNE
jgi:hypothetical protein